MGGEKKEGRGKRENRGEKRMKKGAQGELSRANVFSH